MSRSGAPCQTDDNLVFANQYHNNNKCIVQGGVNATLYSGCGSPCGGGANPASCSAGPLALHFYRTFDNTIYTTGEGAEQVPGPAVATLFSDPEGSCSGWAGWQAAGMDKGSTIKPMPTANEIVAMGKDVLGFSG